MTKKFVLLLLLLSLLGQIKDFYDQSSFMSFT